MAGDSAGTVRKGGAEPLVSVVIPCHGRPQYLHQAIDSARRQDYAHREIIVVDDGSTSDDVAAVVRSHAGVRYIRQAHSGVSIARNRGVQEARGELLVFLDSDDELLPNALEDGVRALAKHPECAFAYGRCEWVNGQGATVHGPELEQVTAGHYRALLRSNFIIIDTVMHRRATFEEVGGFRAGFSGVEDYDLYLRLARRFPVHYHGKVVARYRRHPDNMSNNAGLMLAGVVRLLREERQHLRDALLRAVCREGITGLSAWWGDKVVTHMRADYRAGRWRAVGRAAVILLRFYPRLLAAQLRGALRTRVGGSRVQY